MYWGKTMSVNNIFLYQLDYELQKLFGIDRQYHRNMIMESYEMIIKVAILVSDEKVIIPISNYLESDIAFNVLNNLLNTNSICDGVIYFVSSSYNLKDLLEKKKVEHGANFFSRGYHYRDLETKKIYLPGAMIQRERSATSDIRNSLTSEDGFGLLGRTINRYNNSALNIRQINKQVDNIFLKLGNKAIMLK